MTSFVVTLAVLAISSVSYAKPPQQIVGGTRVETGEVPYLVSLSLDGSHFCGGSIVSNRHIVTAAHCVVDLKKSEYSSLKIRAGSIYSGSGGKVYTVESIKSHEDYDQKDDTSPNDIAVIKVKETIEFDSNIKKIDLPASAPVDRSEIVASGWGLREASAWFPSSYAYKVTLKTVTSTRCQRYHDVYISRTHVCSLGPVGEGICMGDSGGPVASGNELIGVVSFGLPCAVGYPDVLTSVYYFKDWINKALKE